MAAYTLYFSDPTKTDIITVPDTSSGTGINNYDTSLDLIGSGYLNYGSATAQNFLKLLENFSGPHAPAYAIEGQLWYDTSNTSKKVLKVNNGSATSTRWRPVSGIYQQGNDPVLTFSSVVTDGDLWVDTSSNQLKLRYADKWTTVGPSATSGSNKTGSEGVTIQGTDGIYYPVIYNWANGNIVEIISYNEFTPKVVVDGFNVLKPGTNLTNKTTARYNGISEKALSLQISTGNFISASELLKNNAISQTHTGTFSVESGNGFFVKNTSLNKALRIFNDINGSYINLSSNSTALTVGSNNSYLKFSSVFGNIGINTSTTSASPTLDVNGGARFIGTLTINLPSTNSNAIVTNGKIVSSNELLIGSTLTVLGDSNLSDVVTLGTSTNVGISILTPVINDSFDIGTESLAFRNFYVSEIGNTNTFTILNGRVVGTADALTYYRSFEVSGQMGSPSVSFNGDGSVNLIVSANVNLISQQTQTTSTTSTQNLIVCDISDPSPTLHRISKENFLKDVLPNLLTTGMITTYTTSTVPTGFLLCNGSLYSQITYSNLYSVIGTTYGGGVGTFNVPTITATDDNGAPLYYIIRT